VRSMASAGVTAVRTAAASKTGIDGMGAQVRVRAR
jgi:hypothetical protein